jgi:SPW repeat-containing protein
MAELGGEILKRAVWSNLILGLWLMISPFVLVFLNQRVFAVLWEDLILGFGIATFSLCRLLARGKDQIVLSDWLVTALGLITLLNPFVFSYANARYAKWNNVIGGTIVFLLSVYLDSKEPDKHPSLQQRHREAH